MKNVKPSKYIYFSPKSIWKKLPKQVYNEGADSAIYSKQEEQYETGKSTNFRDL